MITIKDVEHVAKLAKLALSKEEMEALRAAKGVTKFVQLPGALLPQEGEAGGPLRDPDRLQRI